MPITSETSFQEFISDGVNAAPIPLSFDARERSHVKMSTWKPADKVGTYIDSYVYGVDYTIDSDWNVTISPGIGAGIPNNDVIRFERLSPRVQPYDFIAQGFYSAEGHNKALDNLIRIIQELADSSFAVSSYVHGNQPGGVLHPIATPAVAGFMSAADKAAWNAHNGAGGAVHPAATQSVAGFMSATDKQKLDALSTQADPLAWYKDDFQGGAIDANRWAISHNVANGSMVTADYEYGAMQINTGDSSGAATIVQMLRGGVLPSRGLRAKFRVRVDLMTSVSFEFGLTEGADAASGSTGAYTRIRRDNGTGLVYRESNGSSSSSSSIVWTGAWTEFEFVFSANGTTCEVFMNGVSQGIFSGTQVPTVVLRPYFRIKMESVSARYILVDYVLLTWTRAYT